MGFGAGFGLDRQRSIREARGVDDAGWGFSSIVHAVTGAAKKVGGAISTVAHSIPLAGTGLSVLSNLGGGIVHGDFSRVKEALTHDPLGHFIGAVASGQNLGAAAQAAVKAGVKDAGEALALAAMVAPMVPGVGSGVAAALGAANALAHGQRISDALLSGVRSAIPGGPLAQAAFDTAMRAAQGQNVTESLLSAARSQLPGGAAAQAAFDAAVALAHGKKLQDVALAAGASLLPPSPYTNGALDFAKKVASGQNISQAALSTAGNAVMGEIAKQGGNIIGQVSHVIGAGLPSNAVSTALSTITGASQPGSRVDPFQAARAAYQAAQNLVPRFGGGGEGPATALLPPGVASVAAAMVNRPELRQLPLDVVARSLGVGLGDVRQAAASMVQSVQRVGESGSPALAPAPHIEAVISANQSLDQTMSELGSRAAAPVQGPSPSGQGQAVFVPRPDRLVSVLLTQPQLRGHPIVNAWMHMAAQGANAQGLDPSGADPGAGKTGSPPTKQWWWLVDKNTWPADVADRVTGNSGRWKEFTAANPQVPKDSSGNFTRFQPGDRLMLPMSWNPYIYADGSGYSKGVVLPPATPPLPIPPKPDQGNTYAASLPAGTIAFVKTQLGKWGQLAGKGVIVPANYPGPLDINPQAPDIIDNNFTSAVASFQTWANSAMRAALRFDGVLDKDTHATLNAYDAGNYTTAPPGVPATPATPPTPPPLTTPPFLQNPPPGAPALPKAPADVPPLTNVLGGAPGTTQPPMTAAQKADTAKSSGALPILALIGLGLAYT